MAAWDGSSYHEDLHEDHNSYYVQQEHGASSSQNTLYNYYPAAEQPTLVNGSYQSPRHCYFEDNQPNNYQQSNIVSQSTLQPTADVFIPSANGALDPSKIFFTNNRNKNKNKKYDNKRNNNHYDRQQQKDSTSRNYNRRQNNNFSSEQTPRDGGESFTRNDHHMNRRTKSHGRFQNDQHRNYKMENTSEYNPSSDIDHQPAGQKNNSKVHEKQQHKTTLTVAPAQYSDDPRDETYRRNPMSRNDRRRSKSKSNGGGVYNNRKEGSSNAREDKNWRKKASHDNKNGTKLDDAASQKDRLTDHLNRGQLECLVCCDYIKQNDSIWSCKNCYHVFHLKCIKKWAESSQRDNSWRCPACQNINTIVPDEYYCFCGKVKDPEWNRRDAAHSCGNVCARLRSKNNCIHKCVLLCHAGSCPPCTSLVKRQCGCRNTIQGFKCSDDTKATCDSVCDKTLNCGIHKCEKLCHHNACGACDKKIHQICHCGKENRDIICDGINGESTFICQNICNKLLECGNHYCNQQCHPGACAVCPLTPALISHCCCGQTTLTEKRESCLEPIPTCRKVCCKKLDCGQPSDPHTCKSLCHSEANCPPCDLTTSVKCRCGNMNREIACIELKSKADDARCGKKCSKKRSCGKHKCNQLCCIEIDHICPLACSKILPCGMHRCELTCHKGRCRPCYRSSFDELYCECGETVIYPPIPCGTRQPICNKPCSRDHPCSHPVLHRCHSWHDCPPCTVLTEKWCYGKHELRKAVPCYLNEMSCGLPCGKPISCGRHKCLTLCHSGPCETPGQLCTQPCTIARAMCGHACAAPCHGDKCPDSPCKETVKVTCACGHRSTTRVCAENAKEYQRIASGILASKMADVQLGHTINLEEVFGQGAKKQNQLKTLPCNDECALVERNRKLALGLQIVNPDLSGKLQPRYSDYMKQWAKKDSHFCQMVHDRLTELVQLAKSSKQKSRSYSFDSMNRDKRHFIHEACEHFGCASQAYDQEPKRNVVATAVKNKCWLPSYSLLEMVQRENGQRKVPRPMLNTTRTNSTPTSRTSEVLPSSAKMSQKLRPTAPTASTNNKTPEPEIDYFDFPNSSFNNM